MGGYLPDGCVWPSDLDYFDVKDRPEREEEDGTDSEGHPLGCVCADCHNAELTAEND